jgi:hypothetical protein
MSPAEQEAHAKRLVRELPDGFAFRAVQAFRLGEQEHRVAQFERDGTLFSLIPGGAITLGYDAARPWQPTPEEREDWEETAEAYDISRSLREYIADVTLRPRNVSIAPFLMETVANEVGWEEIAPDDPDVQAIVRRHLTDSVAPDQVEVFQGDSAFRVERDRHGMLTAQRAETATHAELAAQLARRGFRFPTSDEWEYACGAGAPTLFRWGDHAPCDRYPIHITPPEGSGADWDLHLRPNAFGVYIASTPYHYELVEESGFTRGGDGGSAICGGMGAVLGWLTLATAYFEDDACRRDSEEPIDLGYTVARRVLPLE